MRAHHQHEETEAWLSTLEPGSVEILFNADAVLEVSGRECEALRVCEPGGGGSSGAAFCGFFFWQ